MKPQDINPKISLKKITTAVAEIRERKGKDKETIALIDKAIELVHDFIVQMYLEKALKYQHIYMEERDKLEKGDKKRMAWGAKMMSETVDHALKYVMLNSLDRWESRVCRFYGRVNDYRGRYKQAIAYYKKALENPKKDPEYLETKMPRWLEYEAFIAYSTIMTGQVKKGIALSKALYRRFKTSADGKFLKGLDYTTWAIWITGISTRAIAALLDLGKKPDKKKALAWLKDSEKILNPPKGTKTWVDFKYRKDEVAALRKLL